MTETKDYTSDPRTEGVSPTMLWVVDYDTGLPYKVQTFYNVVKHTPNKYWSPQANMLGDIDDGYHFHSTKDRAVTAARRKLVERRASLAQQLIDCDETESKIHALAQSPQV